MKYCEYFDGGTCCNAEEFPNGVPTEISQSYCETNCKHYKEECTA